MPRCQDTELADEGHPQDDHGLPLSTMDQLNHYLVQLHLVCDNEACNVLINRNSRAIEDESSDDDEQALRKLDVSSSQV